MSLETMPLETMDGPEGTILCADDTEAQRYAVARVLRRAGYRVLEASTGKQALEMTANGPDLVVLDVNLPDISGIEVCRQIKSSEATARTPVLQVSATLVSTEARVAGLEGGADAYLVQPIEPDELTATVRALLRVRRTDEVLWKSQMQYRAFFEANPLPCWVFDTSNHAILTVNAAAVQYYGYSKEEFTNLTLRDLFAPEEQSALSALLAGAATPRPLLTWKQRNRSGKLADVEMSWAPLELNGRNFRLVIVQDITQRLELQAVEKKEEIRQLLMERILMAQEDERRRIARDLHDEAGQLMTSLLIGLRGLADARRLVDAKKQAKRMREIASDAIDELSRLSRGLHSSVLDNLGFQAAIGRYADEFHQMHSIRVNFEFGDSQFSDFSRDEQLHLYRIVQEAFTNIARHSRAKTVVVKFDHLASDLRLTIRDDGQGFVTSSGKQNPARHLGIEGMRQRAAIMGGSLQVSSPPQGGVEISLRIPRGKRARGRNNPDQNNAENF